jgi:hypothetical protein
VILFYSFLRESFYTIHHRFLICCYISC